MIPDENKSLPSLGDWVRFYQNGRLVTGVVEYISLTMTYKREVHTDIGTVLLEDILETRARE